MATRVARERTWFEGEMSFSQRLIASLPYRYERLVEWVQKPPYSKRFLRSELRALDNDITYARKLSREWQCRRERLSDLVELAEFYREQAVEALERNDPLEFHKYLYYSEAVLFFYLLRHEELTKRTSDVLTLKKYAYRRAITKHQGALSNDERALVRRIRHGTATHEEWLKLYHQIHRPRYKKHQERRIKRAERNRRVRQLAIVTLVSLGFGLTIFLASVLSSIVLPFELAFTVPEFLQENVDLLAFVVLFGLFGAGISELLLLSKRRDAGETAEHPEAAYGFWATAAKLVFGASSALVLLVILSSGIIPVFDPTRLTAEFALCISFAAGFSERLLLKAMQQISV